MATPRNMSHTNHNGSAKCEHLNYGEKSNGVLKTEERKQKPRFIFIISIVHVLVYYLLESYDDLLEFDPSRPYEIWRYWTIAFVHQRGDYIVSRHLLSNVICQLIVGSRLETRLSWKRTAFIYLTSVCFGSLFLGAEQPYYSAIGASGGVYGLWAATFVRYLIMERKSKNLHSKISAICCCATITSSVIRTVMRDVQFVVRRLDVLKILAGLAGFLIGCALKIQHPDEVPQRESIMMLAMLVGIGPIDFTFPPRNPTDDPVSHYGHFGGAVGGVVAGIWVRPENETFVRIQALKRICIWLAGIIVSTTLVVNLSSINELEDMLLMRNNSMHSKMFNEKFQSLANVSSDCYSYFDWD